MGFRGLGGKASTLLLTLVALRGARLPFRQYFSPVVNVTNPSRVRYPYDLGFGSLGFKLRAPIFEHPLM